MNNARSQMIHDVYIISWFGQDDIRAKRKEYHEKQIEWYLSRGFWLTIYAQEYEAGDYYHHQQVRYIKNRGALKLPGEARNVLLDSFYGADSDYAIFADNDAVLYDHGIAKEFELTYGLGFHNVDFVCPVNPAREPFNEKFAKNPTLYADNHVFGHMNPRAAKGSFMILRNYAKAYGKFYKFDETFKMTDGSLLPCEETDFAMQLMKDGLGIYRYENLVLKEFSPSGKISTWSRDVSSRKDYNQVVYEKLVSKYPEVNKANDVVCLKSFVQKYNRTQKQVVVNIRPALDF